LLDDDLGFLDDGHCGFKLCDVLAPGQPHAARFASLSQLPLRFPFLLFVAAKKQRKGNQ
jgi:hypothetical protein